MMTTRDAARMLQVSEDTVRRMFDDGTLSGWMTAGGHRRLDPESVAAVAKERQP